MTIDVASLLKFAHSVAVHIAGDDDDFRSAANEALTRALAAYDEGRGELRTFVARCVRNAVLRELRSRYRRPEVQDAVALDGAEAPAVCGRVAVFDSLTPEQRALAEDYWLERLKLREIAARELVSVSAIHARLRRIVKKLEVVHA